MAAPTPTAASELRVRVQCGLPDREDEDVFLLALALDESRDPLPDAERVAAFAALAHAPGPADRVRIGRSYGLAPGSPVTEEVTVRLGTVHGSQRELEAAVAEVFRSIIGGAGAPAPPAVDHDAAIATSLSLVCELTPSLRRGDLSVRAEDHTGGRWAVRISAPGPSTFDVHLGFVDGHPGTTHVHRSRPVEVVDSVGT